MRLRNEHIIRDEADRLRIQTCIQVNPGLWDEDQINPNRTIKKLQ